MTSVSISQLKANPAKVIEAAEDFPVAVQSRSATKAYVVGKELFERLERFIEDYVDLQAVRTTDFSKGRDFEEVAKRLGI